MVHGITPAYAGKRLQPQEFGQHRGDHPRVCGEKYAPAAVRPCRVGSPPRMRGKDGSCAYSFIPAGITPAYAGKRAGRKKHVGKGEDHPRVCGEKASFISSRKLPLGSPPRMRGKERRLTKVPSPKGITPAYAGKRNTERGYENGAEDHPRVCGEKLTYIPTGQTIQRSPPRMRGKGIDANRSDFRQGITPAYAGKSYL